MIVRLQKGQETDFMTVIHTSNHRMARCHHSCYCCPKDGISVPAGIAYRSAMQMQLSVDEHPTLLVQRVGPFTANLFGYLSRL